MGLLLFQNQIKSIGIILDVIYLTSTALGQRDLKDRSLAQKFGWLTHGYIIIFKNKMNNFTTSIDYQTANF